MIRGAALPAHSNQWNCELLFSVDILAGGGLQNVEPLLAVELDILGVDGMADAFQVLAAE